MFNFNKMHAKYLQIGQIYVVCQKPQEFFKIMSGILDPRIPTFWNSVMFAVNVRPWLL